MHSVHPVYSSEQAGHCNPMLTLDVPPKPASSAQPSFFLFVAGLIDRRMGRDAAPIGTRQVGGDVAVFGDVEHIRGMGEFIDGVLGANNEEGVEGRRFTDLHNLVTEAVLIDPVQQASARLPVVFAQATVFLGAGAVRQFLGGRTLQGHNRTNQSVYTVVGL